MGHHGRRNPDELPGNDGGFFWGDFVGFVRDSGPFHVCVFLVYIAPFMVAMMNLVVGMFVQHEVALDALCGATCVTTQGFPCIVNGELDLADMGIVFIELSGDGCR